MFHTMARASSSQEMIAWSVIWNVSEPAKKFKAKSRWPRRIQIPSHLMVTDTSTPSDNMDKLDQEAEPPKSPLIKEVDRILAYRDKLKRHSSFLMVNAHQFGPRHRSIRHNKSMDSILAPKVQVKEKMTNGERWFTITDVDGTEYKIGNFSNERVSWITNVLLYFLLGFLVSFLAFQARLELGICSWLFLERN